MGIFGWDLPPGCSERAAGGCDDGPSRCEVCGRFSSKRTCPLPRKCAAVAAERQRVSDEAEAKLDKELEEAGAEYFANNTSGEI